MKVALALFVKNEEQNIASWIAWHLALGADKLFIYDDNSDDSTYEIIEAATHKFDIKLRRAIPKESTSFFFRQRDCYLEACKEAEEQGFDWISFLDGDEFISLEHDATIQDFLSKFPDCNAIALNWRIYGSSKRVFKTKLATYEAYTHHCTKSLGDCALVKSFIRPEDFTYRYSDPHRFKLQNEVYVDALGNTFKWKDATKEILWEGAYVNHYICRSMEDFVERIKRRINTDQKNSTDTWNYFNKNDIFCPEKPEQISKANAILSKIKEECFRLFLLQNIQDTPFIHLAHSKARVVSFITFHKNVPGLKDHEQKFSVFNDNESFIKVYGVIYDNFPNFVYIFYVKDNQISNIPFLIREKTNIASSHLYIIEETTEAGIYAIKSLTSDHYMCFFPDNGSQISVNREVHSHWEHVSLQEENIDVTFSCCPEVIISPEIFIGYLQKYREKITYADFILAYNQLNTSQKKQVINHYNGGGLLSWI